MSWNKGEFLAYIWCDSQEIIGEKWDECNEYFYRADFWSAEDDETGCLCGGYCPCTKPGLQGRWAYPLFFFGGRSPPEKQWQQR